MRSRLSRIGRVLNFGLAGDAALADLWEGLEHDEWTRKVVNEADDIVRRYGATLGDAQRAELCRAL
jgi:hypothetical protein